MASIFSRIIAGEIPCHRIAEDERYLAFLDIMPLVEGHVLVIPKVEVDWLFDLDADWLGGMMVFAQPVARAIQRAVPCRKVGVSVIGLEVPHAHIHLLPLQSVSDMNFEKAKLAPTPEALAAMASRIREAI